MKKTSVKWKENEIEFLKKNYPTKGVELCSIYLGRTKGAIKRMAIRLKIKSNRINFIYCKENMVKVIGVSKSITDVLKHLDLVVAGGNFRTIKKYIDKYEINTDHFETPQDRNKRVRSNKFIVNINDLLVENCDYSRHALKRRLINEKIKEYKCEICNNNGVWNGMRISLQLDHRNGINNDNRIENLRFLCPNCHSQTDTFAGKNNQKKICSIDIDNFIFLPTDTLLKIKMYLNNGDEDSARKFIIEEMVLNFSLNDIGKKFGVNVIKIKKWINEYGIKFCDKRLTINLKNKAFSRRKVERPPYDVLLKEIEETNYLAVGKKYNVSDNAVRKWVKTYEKSYGIKSNMVYDIRKHKWISQ